MEPINSPKPLGVCSLPTMTMTQTTSREHSSVSPQTEIPANHPLITNGYLYAHSPGQSESAMTEQGGHPTTRISLESLLERLAVVPTGKLLHITHIADMVGESAMCPRNETPCHPQRFSQQCKLSIPIQLCLCSINVIKNSIFSIML